MKLSATMKARTARVAENEEKLRLQIPADMKGAMTPISQEAARDLLAACEAVRSVIIFGNGREIDWNAIVDQLTAAIKKTKESA